MAQPVHVGPAPGQLRLLLPALTDEQLARYAPPPLLPLVAAARTAARLKLAQLPAPDLSAKFRPFSGAAAAWAAKVSATPQFQAAFDGQRVDFGWISIASLVTYQHWIAPMDALMPMAEDELLTWCLPEAFQTQYGASVSAPVPNRWDVLFETQDPNATFAVGQIPGGPFAFGPQPRLNWAQVATNGALSLLANGNHRAALLACAALSDLPVMRRHVASLAEVLPAEPGAFTLDQVMASRPPMVCDFLNPDLTYDLPSAPRRRLMQVRVEMVEHRLP